MMEQTVAWFQVILGVVCLIVIGPTMLWPQERWFKIFGTGFMLFLGVANLLMGFNII